MPANISALVDLIAQASKVVEAAYAKTEKPWIPDLDDVETHPLDEQAWEKELKIAIQTIEGACAQLCATIAKPSYTLAHKNLGFIEPVCINIALTYKIPDVLAENPDGMHITEIGERTGLEPTKVGRVLRLLATKHVFREVSENVFANNRLSVLLESENPMYSLSLHATDHVQKSATSLPEVLGDKEWGHSFSPRHTAFNRQSQFAGSLFEYFEGATLRGSEIGARFGRGMVAWAQAFDSEAVIDQFPWMDIGHGASVCDVGGGVGNMLIALSKRYPTLQLTLQDLPERTLQAKTEVWPVKCPQAIAENRIDFVPIDFLKEAPVPGCEIYYLKNIIHDWPNAEAVTILSNVRKAMAPPSRLLLHEFILQSTNRVPASEAKYEQAPEPLLPNYGLGRITQYYVDINMMVQVNSQERRLSEYIELGEAAGLKFEKLWDFGTTGLVEYRVPEAKT
ncbi:S-adenosyl-L-methionine-dependent methyltransferase [Panaeolus papilionaceus]|nr:S-adenosyl-L-methionine-dependent methyltransferase [Panaeolus papilionaceus]